jgi:hypothetical protein
MEAHGRMEVQFHAFLTSGTDGGELSASRPGRFTPCLDVVAMKSCSCWNRKRIVQPLVVASNFVIFNVMEQADILFSSCNKAA